MIFIIKLKHFAKIILYLIWALGKRIWIFNLFIVELGERGEWETFWISFLSFLILHIEVYTYQPNVLIKLVVYIKNTNLMTLKFPGHYIISKFCKSENYSICQCDATGNSDILPANGRNLPVIHDRKKMYLKVIF